jgi:hypothetical protein
MVIAPPADLWAFSIPKILCEADWGRDPQRQQTFQRLNRICKVVVSEVIIPDAPMVV